MSHTVLKKNIERLLKERKWRVSDLESKIGGKAKNVSNIYRGLSKNPTIEVLQSIANAFKVEVQELLLDKENYDYDTMVNMKLLSDTWSKTLKELEAQELPINATYNTIFSVIKEIYEYSVQLNLDHADSNFLKWTLQQKILPRK